MKKLQKGFTLIELMIVVAIIAILAAVAAPRFGTQLRRSRDAKAVALAGTWQSAHTLNYSTSEQYALNFGALFNDVDTTTINNSFTTDARTAALTSTSSNAAIFFRAGTGSLGGNNSVSFEITGTVTGASMNFTSDSGINTANVAWNTVLTN